MKTNFEKQIQAGLLLAAMLMIVASCSSGEKTSLPSDKTSSVQMQIDSGVPEDGEIPFVAAEKMPIFPGGDSVLLKFISENIRYPENAKANNIQGRVIVRFCVTSKGSISQVSVIRGVNPELDAEAIRVVKMLPSFEPGYQGGKPVPVWYMVPINYALK